MNVAATIFAAICSQARPPLSHRRAPPVPLELFYTQAYTQSSWCHRILHEQRPRASFANPGIRDRRVHFHADSVTCESSEREYHDGKRDFLKSSREMSFSRRRRSSRNRIFRGYTRQSYQNFSCRDASWKIFTSSYRDIFNVDSSMVCTKFLENDYHEVIFIIACETVLSVCERYFNLI